MMRLRKAESWSIVNKLGVRVRIHAEGTMTHIRTIAKMISAFQRPQAERIVSLKGIRPTIGVMERGAVWPRTVPLLCCATSARKKFTPLICTFVTSFSRPGREPKLPVLKEAKPEYAKLR